MTVQSPEHPLPSQPSWQDDEIDLRAYILVLAQWWREIALITVLAAVMTFAGTLFVRQQQSAQYKATANVVLARFISQVQLDERVSTVMETGGTDNVWRTSVVGLVNNGTTAAVVFAELADRLPEELDSPAELAAVVKAEIATSADGRTLSDILLISATTEDPQLSAQIADAWARHFVRYINTLYGEIPQETIETVQADLEAAQREWETAQATYERYLIDNRLDEYQSELATKLEVRDTLLAIQRASLATLVNTDHDNRTSVYNAIARVQAANIVASVDHDNAATIQSLTHLQRLRLAVELQLTQATGLVTLLEAGGDPATTADSLRQLKLQIFAATPPGINVPSGFTTIATADIPAAGDVQALLTDARTLVSILETNRTALDTAIMTQTELAINQPAATALGILAAQTAADTPEPDDSALAAMRSASQATLFSPGDWILAALNNNAANDGTQPLITVLEGEIRTLRGAVAAEGARERQITQRRDLAWTSYEALSNKLQELNLMRTSANSQVRLASSAVPPLKPEPRGSSTLPIAGATGAALLFGVFLALFVNMMGGKPFLSRRGAQA